MATKKATRLSDGLSYALADRALATEARLIISTFDPRQNMPSLVPATANACVPICTPAGGGVIACACCCRTIVCAPMYAAIDASNAHRCQWTANSGVGGIN